MEWFAIASINRTIKYIQKMDYLIVLIIETKSNYATFGILNDETISYYDTFNIV